MINERPTLRDVAQLAGVSLGTASNVLNNRMNVSDEARKKVIEAAAALGYRHQVRVVATGERALSVIGTIGKVDHGEVMTTNPFYSHVLTGVERECQRHNLSLMIANIEVDAMNRPAAMPPMLIDKQVDGVLVIGTFLRDTIQFIGRQINKPVILIDAYAPGSRFDSVLTDNINGAFTAVDYLIKQGHRRIGLIGSISDGYPSIRERRKGYLRALKHHKITQTYIEDGLLTRESGYHSTITLLRRSPEITAIFACNDEVAMGVMMAVRDMGRDVPRDLSVIGFDDIDLAQQWSPQLTTMRVDKMLLGVLAVRQLRQRSENPTYPALTTLVSTRLMVRDTVSPPPLT
jgi:DNA-binding LacI/PurR family transcriptional regulator